MKRDWLLDVELLDICFMVPFSRAHDFLAPVGHLGLLERYSVGSDRGRRWRRSEELSCARICSVRGD